MTESTYLATLRMPLSLVLCCVLVLFLSLFGCSGKDNNGSANANQTNSGQATLSIPEAPLVTGFAQYYEPVSAKVSPTSPGYSLPLELSQVVNPQVAERLSTQQKNLLARNGFVLIGRSYGDNLISFYEHLEDSGDPVWVTPDALLHVFHIQFDETLKDIEEEILYDDLLAITYKLASDSREKYRACTGDLQEAARRNWVFIMVGSMLLQYNEPQRVVFESPFPCAELKQELSLIEAHAGFAESPLFKYKEDYSQYVPRGHYTRSEKLKRYFKAMMWYGRMTMLLKGQDISPKALVSAEDARLQTLQAALIVSALYAADQEPNLAEIWRRIYTVTAFFAGFADDLTPRNYAEQIAEVCGTAFAWSKLSEPETFTALRDRLAALPKPKIYGGTGEIELLPPFSPAQLDELLGDTQGLRLMGQRYTPDSYIFQRLIAPVVVAFLGEGKPFTMEVTQAGPARCWARGLDVMAVLGSDRASQLLQQAGDTTYDGYEDSFQTLRGEFAALGQQEWIKNLYWGWLHTLRALIEPRPEGYPNFMRTPAWEDRQLQAALASWAQLRHDTILYAKQPYAPVLATAAPPPPPPAPPSPGYVEALPEFYARLLALTQCMQQGLTDLGVLPEAAKAEVHLPNPTDLLQDLTAPGGLPQGAGVRLQNTADLLQQLLDISRAELTRQALTEQQESVIKHFSSWLIRAVGDRGGDTLKTTIVADVQTDINTHQVLEEGTGYLRVIIGAYSDAQGHIFLGRGATLSYYEFKQPMADRLTDEAWREKLRSAPPAPPEWLDSIAAE